MTPTDREREREKRETTATTTERKITTSSDGTAAAAVTDQVILYGSGGRGRRDKSSVTRSPLSLLPSVQRKQKNTHSSSGSLGKLNYCSDNDDAIDPNDFGVRTRGVGPSKWAVSVARCVEEGRSERRSRSGKSAI